MTKPMTQVNYLQHHGRRCPWCHTADVQRFYPYDEPSSFMTANVRCKSCGSDWVETHTISGYGELRVSALAAAASAGD